MFFFIIFQFIIVAILVSLVMLQSSSSGGLANFTSNYTNIFSAKSTINFLTKATWVLVILFFMNTMLLSKFYSAQQRSSIIDKIETAINDNNTNNNNFNIIESNTDNKTETSATNNNSFEAKLENKESLVQEKNN